MQAEARDGQLLHALARIVGLTLAALGAAFVLTMLLAGHADAAAAETGAERPTSASITDVASEAGGATSVLDGDAADDSSASPRPALWADADALSAASARRAATASPGAVWSSTPSGPPLAEPAGTDRGPTAAPAVGVTSSPIGSFGASGGAPDAGPSVTQLAVLAAALLGVLWLSQRLLASELSWRSAFLTLSIERPG